jgi:hypothetical protein
VLVPLQRFISDVFRIYATIHNFINFAESRAVKSFRKWDAADIIFQHNVILYSKGNTHPVNEMPQQANDATSLASTSNV